MEVRTGRLDNTAVMVTRITYGSDGFVSSVERDSENYENYRWRPDGRPMRYVVVAGSAVSYDFSYDAAGRHIATTLEGDGYYDEETHLSQDFQGRLVQADIGIKPGDGEAFAPIYRLRWRWESGLCQPVIVPGEPPRGELSVAGLISPKNISFGCAP